MNVTLIRVSAPGFATFFAVPAPDALPIIGRFTRAFTDLAAGTGPDDIAELTATLAGHAQAAPGDLDANTMPWTVLPPLVKVLAADYLAAVEAHTVLTVGTVVDGEWTSWYPPCPRPPVPGVLR